MEPTIQYPSHSVAPLLAQHEALRELASECVACARALPSQGRARLLELMDRLTDAIEGHNRYEEQLLEPALREADAWGAERIAQMIGHHRREHAILLAEWRRLTQAASEQAPEKLARTVYRVANALYQHMDLEEQEYLNARVLRDDVVATDPDDG